MYSEFKCLLTALIYSWLVCSGLGVTALLWAKCPTLGFSGLGVNDLRPPSTGADDCLARGCLQGLGTRGALVAMVMDLGALDVSIGVPSGTANKRSSGW